MIETGCDRSLARDRCSIVFEDNAYTSNRRITSIDGWTIWNPDQLRRRDLGAYDKICFNTATDSHQSTTWSKPIDGT